MNFRIILSLFFAFCLTSSAFAQLKIPFCPIDSIEFPKAHQRKMWVMDTLQVVDIEHRINYLSALHRGYLPRYQRLKKTVKEALGTEEKEMLQSLNDQYREVLSKKSDHFSGLRPGFNENLPVFTHINWLIIFETFGFYPDINAILLGVPYFIDLSSTEGAKLLGKIDAIHSRTKSHLNKDIGPQFGSFLDGMQKLQERESVNPMFQGAITPEDRAKFDWVSFLLWCNNF